MSDGFRDGRVGGPTQEKPDVSESLLNQPRATADVERDVVAVRGRLDYPRREAAFPYIAALDALDRLARDAAECWRLREQLHALVRVAAQYLDTGRGDLDGRIDAARGALGVEGEQESGGERRPDAQNPDCDFIRRGDFNDCAHAGGGRGAKDAWCASCVREQLAALATAAEAYVSARSATRSFTARSYLTSLQLYDALAAARAALANEVSQKTLGESVKVEGEQE